MSKQTPLAMCSAYFPNKIALKIKEKTNRSILLKSLSNASSGEEGRGVGRRGEGREWTKGRIGEDRKEREAKGQTN